MGGCAGANRSEACPSTLGPDYDIGNSPILVTLPNGKRALFAGTKGADVLALDPDANGKVLFRVNPSGQPVGFSGRGRGGIVWGGAADPRQVYYGMGAAGLGAVQSPDGKTAWVFTAPGAGGRGVAALGAAPTAIPGVVFQVPAMAGCSPCRPPTANNSGSSTPRRTSTPRTRCPRAAAHRHRGRGRRGRHGLHRVRICDQQRRAGRQRPAGLWSGVVVADG